MSPYIFREGWFLLYSVLLGIGITFVYDCLRIFRRVAVHGMFWISIEDLLYWIFVSFSIFYLLYYENDGAFRWFAVLGVLAGMFLYQKTLSPLYVKYVSRFLIWIKKKLEKLFLLLSRPLRLAGRWAGQKTSAAARRFRRFTRILKKRLTVRARMAKMEISRHKKKK